MTRKLVAEELKAGDVLHIGRGTWLGEMRTVESVVPWQSRWRGDPNCVRVEFEDGTTRVLRTFPTG